MKYIFNEIPVKPGDFVYLYYMDFDDYVLCQAKCGSYKGQLIVEGIANFKEWDYTSFVIGLNSYQGQRSRLFDFTPHKDSREERKVWIAKWIGRLENKDDEN